MANLHKIIESQEKTDETQQSAVDEVEIKVEDFSGQNTPEDLDANNASKGRIE